MGQIKGQEAISTDIEVRIQAADKDKKNDKRNNQAHSVGSEGCLFV